MENIKKKILAGERITLDEARLLVLNTPLFELSSLAQSVKKRKSGDMVFYNRNFHLEPTNICTFHCVFCSYRKNISETESWNMTLSEVEEKVKQRLSPAITEVHLVGGVHPDHTLEHYIDIIRTVRHVVGEKVAIKAFSAVEHIYVIEKAGLSYAEGLKKLCKAGMDTITGGGAEIFAPHIRKRICPDKARAEQWLRFHKTAHEMGIKTTATMLYGHIETLDDVLNHLEELRNLQDTTKGFVTFIPLKYRMRNNNLSHVGECSVVYDMKIIALSRIFLDNIDHIKAYSPMYGAALTQNAILFGADDIDGTVKDTTKIYSMAGVQEKGMTEEQMIKLIEDTGYKACERDTFYNWVG